MGICKCDKLKELLGSLGIKSVSLDEKGGRIKFKYITDHFISFNDRAKTLELSVPSVGVNLGELGGNLEINTGLIVKLVSELEKRYPNRKMAVNFSDNNTHCVIFPTKKGEILS